MRFRAAETAYALPVEHVTEVRSAADLTSLPTPRVGVAGLVARADGALTVLSVLGASGSHVIVVEEGPLTFGLLVDEVTDVVRVDDARIGPPPKGQAGVTVAGVIHDDDELVLLLDAVALRATLSA
ncbi:MAG: purine-binding chemotaxis protein CheW [Actinomycetota bacterium]|nr:purine-binding chemotaxis protein CheW [Actinomycetota bacterium]